MNTEILHDFVAGVPGTPGDHVARRVAVSRIAAGSVDHAAALVGLVGPDLIPVLIRSGAPSVMVRAAIEHAVHYRYHELRSIDRAAFVTWCCKAEFVAPPGTPDVIDLYRGTLAVSPAVAARGWHWTPRLDSAAIFGARFADAALTGVIVIHARIPRAGIAAFIANSAHDEVIPAEAPADYKIVTDKKLIGEAALREEQRQIELQARFGPAMSYGNAEQAAMAARARMALAGVDRGTAIVADIQARLPGGMASTGSAVADAFIERACMKLRAEGVLD